MEFVRCILVPFVGIDPAVPTVFESASIPAAISDRVNACRSFATRNATACSGTLGPSGTSTSVNSSMLIGTAEYWRAEGTNEPVARKGNHQQACASIPNR